MRLLLRVLCMNELCVRGPESSVCFPSGRGSRGPAWLRLGFRGSDVDEAKLGCQGSPSRQPPASQGISSLIRGGSSCLIKYSSSSSLAGADFRCQRVGQRQRPRQPKTVFLSAMLSSPCFVLFDCHIFLLSLFFLMKNIKHLSPEGTSKRK